MSSRIAIFFLYAFGKPGLYLLSGKTSYRRISSRSRAIRVNFFNRSEIWQASRQQRRRIAELCDDDNIESRVFETSRGLAVRRLAT